MSKPTAPPIGFVAPPDAPPTYNQAMGVGPQAPYHPQAPAVYPVQSSAFVPPQQPGLSGRYHSHLYGPAPTGYPVGQHPTHVTVVTTVVPPGPNPTHMVCPHCHAEIDSSVKTTPSVMAWISGAVIALLGCWMGCCLIPCCIDDCLDRDHYCPNCKAYLGRFQR